jgi:cytoskeletal protein CcmA (bactofilin family)
LSLAVLSEGTRHEGELEYETAVRIDGTVVGGITSTDFVEIGPKGRVEGWVVAPQLLCGGVVIGEIECAERVTILDTARVRGRVTTPWLDIRVGARVTAEIAVERD